MSAALELTPDEGRLLAQILLRLAQDSARPTSLNQLLSGWEAFVRAVESGYDDSIDEYTNDLSVRDRLEALIGAAPPGLSAKLVEAVSPIDRRFMDATEQAAVPLARREGRPAVWWCRVPRRRIGELADDLESLGHLG